MTFYSFAQYVPAMAAGVDAVLLFVGGIAYAMRARWRHVGGAVWGATFIAMLAQILYAVYMTLAQYAAWGASPLTKALLAQPLDAQIGETSAVAWIVRLFHLRSGYFTYYVYGRFWLAILLGIGCAIVFWGILALLKKYRSRFFDETELQVGLLAALVVGWPLIVLFVPLVFVMVVLVSLVRMIFFKEKYTTLGWPMLLAAAGALVLAHIYPQLLGHFAFLTV
ncbi:MAG: hypothetical protein WC246_00610 [Candidatus Paceibacterota bacterium]|jgi:hypothetical protein